MAKLPVSTFAANFCDVCLTEGNFCRYESIVPFVVHPMTNANTKMKRDRALIHQILKFVETNGSRRFSGRIPIDGYEREEVVEHLYLMADGGLIELGQQTLSDKGILVLTWKGCDYIDALRAKEQASGRPIATAPTLESTPQLT